MFQPSAPQPTMLLEQAWAEISYVPGAHLGHMTFTTWSALDEHLRTHAQAMPKDGVYAKHQLRITMGDLRFDWMIYLRPWGQRQDTGGRSIDAFRGFSQAISPPPATAVNIKTHPGFHQA